MKHLKKGEILMTLILIAFFAVSPSRANSDFALPLPQGSYIVTNNSKGHEAYLAADSNFKIDLQAAEMPPDMDISPEKNSAPCFSYGTPILATKAGVISKVISIGIQQSQLPDYGAHVIIDHEDGSSTVYSHMISNSNDKYVQEGENVKKGQILGLMGDTGYVRSKWQNGSCFTDNNRGTHLHFEIRNPSSSEPFQKNFQIGQVVSSNTLPYDPNNIYSKYHADKYPYQLNLAEVHSITPLQVVPGSNSTFLLNGKNFSHESNLSLPFCKSQKLEIINTQQARILCSIINKPGLQEGSFYNPKNKNDLLEYQIEIKDKLGKSTNVKNVDFITPKPGEYLNLHIRGYNLPGNLHIAITDKQGGKEICKSSPQFSYLSPRSIRSRCQLPLNLGPVKANGDRHFQIKIHYPQNNELLYSGDFQINYGISAAQLSPIRANYYIPTRFKISGKNVHRSTVFFIEGCNRQDLKIISQSYEEVELECLIFPLIGADLDNLGNKAFKHQYFFKTRSRYGRNGVNELTDLEDEANTILSGYIELSYDQQKIYEPYQQEPESMLEFSPKPKVTEGTFKTEGPAEIKKVELSSINRKNRQETITVHGVNLPRNLKLYTDDCHQTALTYRSSKKYIFLCLLKKVSLLELKFVDKVRQNELHRQIIDIKEVYTAIIIQKDETTSIKITGVNLGSQTVVKAPDCNPLKASNAPSSSELNFSCQLPGGEFSTATEIHISVLSKDGFHLFNEAVHIDTHSSISKSFVIDSKKYPLFSSELLRLDCDQLNNENLYLGECQLYSPFLRQAMVLASYDKLKKLAILEGKFDSTIHQKLDEKLGKIKLNPASGEGLIIADIPDDSILFSGKISAIGFDLADILGFNFDFDLYDYRGEAIISLPDFDISKPRKKSKTVFGIGNGTNPQSELIKKYAREFTKVIKNEIKKTNVNLNKKKIDIGNQLVAAIENETMSAISHEAYIQILKALKIVPKKLIFYDNFDFVASGKLKSEPFKPEKWRKNTAWIAEANLAELDIDFSAKDARLRLKGNVLNSLSLFNNEIIKTDRGLANVEFNINLKQDHGRLDLDSIEIRLPKDIANIKANAHFSHLFQPENLKAWGDIKSKLEIYGIDLAKTGASFLYDPNLNYSLGNYETQGLLQLEAEMKLISLLANGKVIFTLPENQLAADFGGSLNLDFLGYQKRLGDILGRIRLAADLVKACFNSQTGQITFKLPIINREINLQGGISIETELHPLEFLMFDHLILSGQVSESTRIGFKLDKDLFKPISMHNQKCDDAPGEEFLETILASSGTTSISSLQNTPTITQSSTALASSSFFPSVLATDSNIPSSALWDIDGWTEIKVIRDNGNAVIILNADGRAVDLKKDSFDIPGVWIFEDPDSFVIYDADSFKNSGHGLAIINNTNEDIELEISEFTNEEVTTNRYEISDLNKDINSLDINENQISINQKLTQPTQSETTTIVEGDRRIRSEVQSEEFTINSIGSELSTIDRQPSAYDDLFPDIQDPALREAVIYLSQEGIIQGYPDNTFRPDQTINRAEALKIIFKTTGQQAATDFQSPFPDVQTSQWFAPYVSQAKTLGIISGYPDGTYKPWQEVNRAEFVKIAMSAQDNYLEPNDYLAAITQYSDLDINEWYMPYLDFAVTNNLHSDSRKFRPTAGMTRGEAALIIYRIIAH